MIKFLLSLLFCIKLKTRATKNSFKYVKNCYGVGALKNYRKLLNLSLRKKKLSLDLDFLNKCKIYNVLPKFLRFKLYKKELHNSSFYKAWQTKLLSIEIRSKKRNLKEISEKISEVLLLIKTSFSFLDKTVLCQKITGEVQQYSRKVQSTHSKKLRNLGIRPDLSPCDPNSVVHNFSSAILPNKVRTLLAYGLDFCLPIANLNFIKYFFPLEKISAIMKQKYGSRPDFQNFISELKHTAFKYYYNFKSYKVFSIIFTKNDLKLLKNFASNPDIIISKPDKGRGVVIVDRISYISAMIKLISDPLKFLPVENSTIQKYTLKIEDKVNNFLRKMKKENMIDDEKYNNLIASGSSPGILYGLPKIHKEDFSSKFQYRPIFAAYKTPTYNIAKYLVPFLSHLTRNNYTVVNSLSFCREIVSIPNSDKYIMASFDVENLFTNIPVSETIDIILSKLFLDKNCTFLGMTKMFFKSLLELAVLNSFFIFDKKLYRQIEGLGMGLPLGPSFANIFMCHMEEKWLSECPLDFKPVFYRRYIDDSFALFNDQSHIPQFLSYLNSKHLSISFTCDKEQNCVLPFLDCLIRRNNNKFETSVYRKPSSTELGISFYSFIPFVFKLNSIKTLLIRGYHISSNYFNMDREFNFLVNFFMKNGFPKGLVLSQIGKLLYKFRNGQQNLNSQPIDNRTYFSILYFGSQSEKLKKDLNLIFRKYFKDIDVCLVLKSSFNIGSFFNFKDKLSAGMQANLVYEFRCERCSQGYIGSTRRNLYMRVAEHAGKSFRTNNPLSNPPNSSIRDHCDICNSSIAISRFKILNSLDSKNHLLILESLHIKSGKPKLNDASSAVPLLLIDKF